jgi:hypothetical protein
VGLVPFRQSRLERKQPRITLWDLILKTGFGEHARHNRTHNRKGPSTPNRLTDNRQAPTGRQMRRIYSHSLRLVGKTPATSISIMRTMARVTRLFLFTDTRPLAETGLREVRLGQYDSLYRQPDPRVTKSHHGRNEGES